MHCNISCNSCSGAAGVFTPLKFLKIFAPLCSSRVMTNFQKQTNNLKETPFLFLELRKPVGWCAR